MRRTALLTLTIGTILCCSTHAAFAQDPAPAPIARGDVMGIVGWLNVNKSELVGGGSNDWYNRAIYGGGAVGWYWTDHHKTEVEAGASNAARFWTYRGYVVNNVSGYGSSVFTFRTRRLAIDQQYQFFRNAWFHPHVGAGVDFTWETATENSEPVRAYIAQGGPPPQLEPARVVGPDTKLRVRPFGELGFKAYATPRAFFRSDLRLVAHHGLDEVQLRAAFGIDF